MDPLFLARAQFALTVAFHFIFPSITIGLALLIAISLTLHWRRRDEAWARMAAFWTKLFALTFTVGVATGIVMEFQFGTNWSRYSTYVGDIFGSPLAAEGVFAFFLESTFLGLLLFGGSRIGDGLRTFAGWMVALGSTLSGFWIIVANSWMQTPAGYEIQGGKAFMTDFMAAVFNPSTLPRFFHTIASSWTAAAFIVTGVAAWWILRGRHAGVAARSIRLGLTIAFVGAALMFVTGDNHARQVANTQGAKFAGMNGIYVTTTGAPLVVWSLPPTQDPANVVIGPELLVGNMLSFLAYGSFEAPVRGLEEFPTADWPPVMATFLAYHNMVLLGSVMLLVMLVGAFLLWRGRLERSRNWLKAAVIAIPLPMIAIQLGWATAELGRQPWIVYDLMRTSDGTSPVVSAGDLLLSLLLFGVVYTLLFVLWLGMLVREVRRGPAPSPVPESEPAPETAPGSPGLGEPRPLATGTGGR